ncbi:MAG: double-strand break repair helicase AddA [Rhodospirillaceae bacterium]|nr:MAG: double-strand break repair helicase AddA [Rhodospirillaceae bacterium]
MTKTAEQKTGSNPEISVWVRANAGTGKTRVLTDRVLRLLLGKTPPSRILCLTFTKAAAAEMATRVYNELGAWTKMTDGALSEALLHLHGMEVAAEDLDEARRLFAQALDVPGGLKIQTIHSFCESLLSRFPIEAGIAPHFRVMDERTAAELLQDAREAVYWRASKDKDGHLAKALEIITAHVAEGTFTDVLDALLRDRGKFRRGLSRHGGSDGMALVTRAHLGLAPGETEKTILDAAACEAAFDGAGLRKVVTVLLEGDKKDAAHGEIIANWLAKPDRRVAGFDTYLGAFFKDGGVGKRFKTLAYAKTVKRCPDAIDILGAEADRLEAVRDRRNAAILAVATQALLQFGSALLEAFDGLKQKAALLDYDDLIFEARNLLEREGIAPWVLFKLDGGIDHILVDEAQDTNPDQWRVIAMLASEFFSGESARAEKRTIFSVGDVKQSIFSFQRADPLFFGKMRDHFSGRVQRAGEGWRDVPLERSFRSAPVILQAVDAVFSQADARDGVSLEGEKIEHDAARKGQAGLVEIWPVEAQGEKSTVAPWTLPLTQGHADWPEKRLAQKIAWQIGKWRDSKEVLSSRGRAIRPGDILILVRRRGRFFEEIVRALKRHSIPVAGMDRMVLTDHMAVRDLIALGRFVLLPEDDLTLAIVLKSPLVGLDETALFDLAYGRKGSLWDALRIRCNECEAFAAAYDMLSASLARADYVPPFEFYAALLGPLGARERLIARLGNEANDPIDEFLNLGFAYEKMHVPSMEGFLHWIEAGKAQIKRDLEHGRDEVRVMTVHGAKGLEAPIVFLPDTCQVPDKDSPLFWFGDEGADEAGAGVLWVPRRAHEEKAAISLREAQGRHREREYRRLLYVAMTRAEDRLYIAGWEQKKSRTAGCWYDLIDKGLATLGLPVLLAIGGDGRRFEAGQEAPADRGDKIAEGSAIAAVVPPHVDVDTDVDTDGGLPDWARSPAPPVPLRLRALSPSSMEGDAPAIRSPIGADQGRGFQRGRIVHSLLQFLPDVAIQARLAACRRYLSQKNFGLDPATQDALSGEVLAVLQEKEFAPLFGPNSRAEVPIVGEINGRVISGQIDRLLVTETSVFVIDYKTQRAPPATPSATPEIYLRQMAAYVALLEKIYPERRVVAALLWTDGPNLVPLKEKLLRPYAP